MEHGASVRAYDPEAMKNVKEIFGEKVFFAKDQYEALEGADFLTIATEWNAFRSPDFDKISSSLKTKVIFDGRNLYDLNEMMELGYYYCSVGRKSIG